MKLFIKDFAGFMLLQAIQIGLFSLVIVLSGYDNIPILVYGIFISLFVIVTYLGFYYYRRRYVYKKLTTQVTDLQQLLEQTDHTPLGEAVDQIMHSSYQLFIEQINKVEEDQANHLKFIDRWVHQMKTPLSVIELSAKELDEPDSSNIREETDRLKKGLETILYMARMRTIEEDFQIKPVNLNKLIQAVNQENKRLYIRNNVYPHLTVTRSDITVETDEKWLFFIVDQLLHNAVKYTDGRSNRIDIKIDQTATKRAFIEITDYGVGIAHHDIKRIYQSFFTGDNGRKFRESTGMGLYLVKEVVDYLGHEIEVESNVDVRTTFRIYFTEAQTLS